MNKKRRKLHIIKNIGEIIAILTAVIAITYHYTRDNVRLDYLTDQINDIKKNQAQYNEQYNQKLDKIYDILRDK